MVGHEEIERCIATSREIVPLVDAAGDSGYDSDSIVVVVVDLVEHGTKINLRTLLFFRYRYGYCWRHKRSLSVLGFSLSLLRNSDEQHHHHGAFEGN